MKKLVVVVIVLSMLTGFIPVQASSADSPTDNQSDDTYRRLSLTLLSPYVDKAIDDFYDEYMTYLPGEDTWDYKVLSIRAPQPGDYFYTVILEVLPYVGPHLTVGRDRITLKIDNRGNVVLEKLEHLESHELPPHYQNMIKNKLPST